MTMGGVQINCSESRKQTATPKAEKEQLSADCWVQSHTCSYIHMAWRTASCRNHYFSWGGTCSHSRREDLHKQGIHYRVSRHQRGI